MECFITGYLIPDEKKQQVDDEQIYQPRKKQKMFIVVHSDGIDISVDDIDSDRDIDNDVDSHDDASLNSLLRN